MRGVSRLKGLAWGCRPRHGLQIRVLTTLQSLDLYIFIPQHVPPQKSPPKSISHISSINFSMFEIMELVHIPHEMVVIGYELLRWRDEGEVVLEQMIQGQLYISWCFQGRSQRGEAIEIAIDEQWCHGHLFLPHLIYDFDS